MNPARHTSETPRATAAHPRGPRRYSSREETRGDRATIVSIPAARARSSPAAFALFEITMAICAFSDARDDRVDERLKVAAAAGDEDADAAGSGGFIQHGIPRPSILTPPGRYARRTAPRLARTH